MFSSGGGCCDCGDAEAWRPSGFCSRHPGPENTSLDVHVCDKMPPALRASTEQMLDALFAAYLHATVLEGGDEAALKAVGNGVDPRRALLQWLTQVASTSTQLRSLIGLRLASPRQNASGPGGSSSSASGGAIAADDDVSAGSSSGAEFVFDGFGVGGNVGGSAGSSSASTSSSHIVGGRADESVLDVLLRLEAKLCLSVREELHGKSGRGRS